MQTFSSKKFDPEHPLPEQIDLLDIAVALSRIPRFVGHTAFHYSVAQHSLTVASLMRSRQFSDCIDSRRLQLLGLLHDADEAYTSDIPSPVKERLKPAISNIESEIMLAIYNRFNIVAPSITEKNLVKEFDRLSYDLENVHLRNPIAFSLAAGDLNYHHSNERTIQPIDSNLVALLFMREFNLLLE